MADSIISIFMLFLPEQTQLFCVISLAVLFFGVYIPYEERKKKKRQKNKNQSQKLEQLNALKDAGVLSKEEYKEREQGIK